MMYSLDLCDFVCQISLGVARPKIGPFLGTMSHAASLKKVKVRSCEYIQSSAGRQTGERGKTDSACAIDLIFRYTSFKSPH